MINSLILWSQSLSERVGYYAGFAVGALFLAGVAVICILLILFSLGALKANQEKRKRERMLIEASGKLRALLLKAAEGKPAAVPGVYLAYRIVRDRPKPVDPDIADMLEQIARQG